MVQNVCMRLSCFKIQIVGQDSDIGLAIELGGRLQEKKEGIHFTSR